MSSVCVRLLLSLIQRTSVVTLSVAGIFKEVATILLSTLVFHDQLTPINITGLCVALSGIAGYNYIKYRAYKEKEKELLRSEVSESAAAGAASHSSSSSMNGNYRAARSHEDDVEGQFQLVGAEDLESSDDDEDENMGRGASAGIRGGGGGGGSVNGALPSYDDAAGIMGGSASGHSEAVANATRDLEQKVARDPLLVEIDRENKDLEAEMQDTLSEARNQRRDDT